jgi:hypothetical protein
MNPYPFDGLNHFTTPCSFANVPYLAFVEMEIRRSLVTAGGGHGEPAGSSSHPGGGYKTAKFWHNSKGLSRPGDVKPLQRKGEAGQGEKRQSDGGGAII